MSNISCYIVDDEFRSIRLITSMLKDHFPEIEVVGSHTDPQSAMLQISHMLPDLLFLDIQMPGYDGFSLLNNLPHVSSEIIFITAYQEYALRAFDVHASGYLTKPIQTEKFISSVRRAVERIYLKRKVSIPVYADRQNEAEPEISGKLPLRLGRECRLIAPEHILFLESMGNYTRIYLQNDTPQLVCKQLGKLHQELQTFSFCRIHHRYLINLHHVISYTEGADIEVLMRNGCRLPVSRRQKKHFLSSFQQLMGM